jgi:hypothetical protein
MHVLVQIMTLSIESIGALESSRVEFYLCKVGWLLLTNAKFWRINLGLGGNHEKNFWSLYLNILIIWRRIILEIAPFKLSILLILVSCSSMQLFSKLTWLPVSLVKKLCELLDLTIECVLYLLFWALSFFHSGHEVGSFALLKWLCLIMMLKMLLQVGFTLWVTLLASRFCIGLL